MFNPRGALDGKTKQLIALGVAAVWGIYGAFHFVTHSKKKEKPIFMESPATAL